MLDLNGIALAPPTPLLLQLASLSFILCGIHNDLFVIRFYVSLSYCLLIVNCLVSAHQLLQLDNLLWSVMGLYVNGTSLLSLIRDERPIVLSDDEGALWRMLYRSGGLSMRLFSSIVAPHLQVKEVPAGETLPTADHFYLVYKGQVRLQVHGENKAVTLERVVQSGQMFDLRYLELFNDYSDNFFREGDITCTTMTTCKLYSFSRDDIRKIAHHPLAKGVWQSLLINDLSITAEKFASRHLKDHEYDSIFDPLQDWELPDENLPGSGAALRRPLKHFLTSLWRSLRLPWPFGAHQEGIRQTLLPAPRAKPKTSQSHRPFYRRLGQSRQRQAIFRADSLASSRWTPRWSSNRRVVSASQNANGDGPESADGSNRVAEDSVCDIGRISSEV